MENVKEIKQEQWSKRKILARILGNSTVGETYDFVFLGTINELGTLVKTYTFFLKTHILI